MNWQETYKVGDRLIYNGVGVRVSREAYIDPAADDDEYDLTHPMSVVLGGTFPPVEHEVPFHHEHLVKRGCSDYGRYPD